MSEPLSCPLCDSNINLFTTWKKRKYYRCSSCDGIILHPESHLCPKDEQQRYAVHKNDVQDKGYQNFVEPIVSAVKRDFGNTSLGLDFGCGTGPVITKLLNEEGYELKLYDPFFKNDVTLLDKQYDYIVCCEVIEHFNNPSKEFELLGKLLKPNGKLYCKTNLYSEDIDFQSWWYKNDPTHVFIYTQDTLKWIAANFNLKLLEASTTLIVFQNRT